MSGRKNNLKRFQLFSAASLAGSLISAVTDIQFLDNIAIQLNPTGTGLNGTFAVQGSLDYNKINGTVTNPGTWISLTLNPSPTVSGTGTPILIDMTELSFPFIRVIYTAVAGTGSVDGYISGKEL